MESGHNETDFGNLGGPVEEYPRKVSVHALFEQHVRATPRAVAVVAPEVLPGILPSTVTYEQLDERGNAIAALLRARGVTPGAFVTVLMDRSIEMIAAFLGILKAGAAYVPLDASYPRERLDFMLADTQSSVLLTQAHLIQRVTPATPAVVVVDNKVLELSNLPPAAPSVIRDGDAPAYVIYTSGSTGQPKGVVVPHRGIVRLVRATSYARLDRSRVMLQLAPTSFDAATFEIWGALLNGAQSVLYPGTGAPDLALLKSVIADTHVTTMWLTSSLFNMIVETAPTILEGVEELLVGGESLSVSHVRKAYDLLPNVQLINGYGPTESTTFACCYRIPRGFPAEWRSIPIGPPISHTTIVLMGGDGNPVPAGEIGELCIGGDGLAIGYLNSPELTAERFVTNPVGQGGERLYRTGDMARLLPDGAVEFLGRHDDQIKIRGHRVELGEIEATLRDHTAVGDAVVVLRESKAGDKILVGYYTPRTGSPGPRIGELQAHTSSKLPEYMIPSRFIPLERIPLTLNGKADRAALPEPGRERPALERPMVAPRTPVERWVAGHWRDLLSLDEVGVQDRFFELGGTSIIAMRLLSRLSSETGASLPALLLFRAPTVAEMATILEAEYRDTLPVAASALSDRRAASISPTQERASQHRNELRDRRLSAGFPKAVAAANGDLHAVRRNEIAIIGMAGRFPRARDIHEFWERLRDGVECTSEITAEDLREAGVDPAVLNDPDYVRQVFALEEPEAFDAEYFGLSPAEAEMMDPQHRLFLETSSSALEHAGYDPDRYQGLIGVFGGVGRNSYYLNALARRPELMETAGEYHSLIGNERDFPTTQVSYRLNLRGPSVDVQSACSTSGVAIHLACQSLLSGDCDIALAGGCKVIIPNRQGYFYIEGGPLAPEGHVRAFDADAKGMVRGSGAAIIVLKRLDDALADGDSIYGLVIGSAVNNDGRAKVGFTAPSVDGQAAVISEAIRSAGITADQISYVETHGTGTVLGDPVEVAGLTEAFRRSTDRTGFCAIGSVKTNIGHLDAGATVAGVIKTLASLRNELLPHL